MKIRIIVMVLLCSIALSCGKLDKSIINQLSSSGASAEATKPLPSNLNKNKEEVIFHQHKKGTVLENKEKTIPTIESEGIVSPAIEYDMPYETYQIDASLGGTLVYDKTGSTVTIPADCLVDEFGNSITGPVDISYREFHTPKDIFFSGIPMDYEVEGEKQYFESAGMLEINASQNNKEVFIKKGKQVHFSMSTDNTHEEVLLYELDIKSKKWKEISKPTTVSNPIMFNTKKKWLPVYKTDSKKQRKRSSLQVYIQDFERVYDKEAKSYKKQLSIKIKVDKNRALKTQANKKEYTDANYLNGATFVIEDINRSDFKKLMRTLQSDQKKYTGGYYSKIEADLEISSIQSPNKLNLEFSYEGNVINFVAKLNPNLARSKKMKNKVYNIVTDFPINNFEGRFFNKGSYESCIDHYDSMLVAMDWYNKSLIQRQFSSRNFGILNCDQPQKLPHDMIADAAFNIDNQWVVPSFVTLVDTRKNCLYSYYEYKYGEFGFNPDVNNFIFTVMNDGTVGFITPDEFKTVQKSGKITIPFHRVTMDEFAKVMDEFFPAKSKTDFSI